MSHLSWGGRNSGLTECALKSHTDLIKDSFLSRTIGYDRLAMTTLWQG